MDTQPTRQQLQHALERSGCRLDLDSALAIPAIRILLTNYAEALAQQEAGSLKRLSRMAGATDWRARAAGDN